MQREEQPRHNGPTTLPEWISSKAKSESTSPVPLISSTIIPARQTLHPAPSSSQPRPMTAKPGPKVRGTSSFEHDAAHHQNVCHGASTCHINLQQRKETSKLRTRRTPIRRNRIGSLRSRNPCAYMHRSETQSRLTDVSMSHVSS